MKFLTCCKKAGVSSERKVQSQCDDNDPFKLLDAQLQDSQNQWEFSFVDFRVEGYIDVDGDILTLEVHVMKDVEIIA